MEMKNEVWKFDTGSHPWNTSEDLLKENDVKWKANSKPKF
jgi:hypothetical protein